MEEHRSSRGTGLGLALVRAIALSHRLAMDIQPRAPEYGTRRYHTEAETGIGRLVPLLAKAKNGGITVPAQQYVGRFLATFKEFPPSQKPGGFSIDQALESLSSGSGDK